MRNHRVFNWSLRVIAVKVVAVTALSPISMGQSFDYPANSPSIFNRNVQAPTESVSRSAHSPQSFERAAPQSPSLFSKLFKRKPNPSSHAVPSFGQPSVNSSPVAPYTGGEQHTVYLDSQAVRANQANQADTLGHSDRYAAEVRNAFGRTTNDGASNGRVVGGQVQRTNFDQPYLPAQQSILERDVTPSLPPSNTTQSEVKLNTPPKVQPQQSEASRLAQRTIPMATPSSKPTQRVSLPGDAFKKEFEKAYRYINQSKTAVATRPDRLAQIGEAPGALTDDDFGASGSPLLEGDFSNSESLSIETPDFIQPQQSEQSPNAGQPDFMPPAQNGRFDLIPETRVAKPSSQAPWASEVQAADDNFAGRKTDDLETQGFDSSGSGAKGMTSNGLDSDMGDIDDWNMPQTKTNLPSLKDDFEELSRPMNDTVGTTEDSMIGLAGDQSPIWWKQWVNQPLHPDNQTMPVDSNGLVFTALQNSPRIQAVSQNPLIRELQVVEADAEFDPVRFVRTQFQDRVDPVGNSLTIGQGSDVQFLRDNIWTGEAGIRRKLRTGADLTVSQQLGFQNSNSNNFTPQDQGTATLALNVTQPLLRGRGRYFNQAQILIAQSTGGVAWEVFQQELQEELQGVVDAYWQLYLDRSIYLQRKRNVDRGQVILDRLQGRRELDSLPAQIARAKSSVQTRKTELANAFRNIRNAETEIRRRIADRNWMAAQSLELIPAELPTIENVGWELDQVVKTALNHRPEIREAMRRIKIAGVQRDVSENELLPELSFLVGTYVSALQGESDVLGAFADQFGEVTPGYSFGLEYELPRFNRAARSRFQQRHLQFRRLQNELEEVMQNVIAESQVAVRRISSAIETLQAAEEAIIAARADLNQNERRWESFALIEGDIAEGLTPTTILDQLLDSQERLSQSEIVYAQAERELKVAEVALQRSMGTLLMQQRVSYDRVVNADTPVVRISKDVQSNQTPAAEEVFAGRLPTIEDQNGYQQNFDAHPQGFEQQNFAPQTHGQFDFQPSHFQRP